MRLQRVTWEPVGDRHRLPLVFVHGAWHGAWCWSEHFLPYFAQHGFASYAFDLGGHGDSEGRHRLRRTSLADYVTDLDQVVRDLDAPPILVGHSMGSVVVQKYLERHPAHAAVLLAPLPPYGGIPAMLRLAARAPLAVLKANLTMSLRHLVVSPDLARRMFFSEGIPQQRLTTYFSLLQDESYRAFLDMLVLNLPRPRRVRVPVLVLGAERDTIISRREVMATASAYRTEATFYPMAHDMMLEDGWEDVATHIVQWLTLIGSARVGES